MPRSEQSLGESWSSLSEYDLSQDEDLQSDVTDTGSLIDVSTTEDIHSVDEHGESSDAGEDMTEEEQGIDIDRYKSSTIEDNRKPTSFELRYQSTYSQENIRLEDSTVVVDSSGISSLQASKSFSEAEMRSSTANFETDEASEEMVGIVRMSMSPESLLHAQRPYHILYYSSPLSSNEIRSEVLGKIGAALISSSNHHKLEESSESFCYHVVPSEFGPGSKPTTADLIPIPTQIHVSECTVSNSQVRGSPDSTICLQLGTGRSITSRRARFWEVQGKEKWPQPDLAVIIVSQRESEQGRLEAKRMVEFANRHQISLLCLRQEPGWDEDGFLADVSPHMLHKFVLPVSAHQYEPGRKMLVDIDLFLALDTEQLNQHLSYLGTPARGHTKTLTTLDRPFSGPLRGFRDLFTTKNEWRSPLWILETSAPQLQRHSKRAGYSVRKMASSWYSDGNRPAPTAALRRTLGVLVVTVLTMLLFYSFQTALPALMSTEKSITLAISDRQSSTTEVIASTATSQISSYPTTSTQIYALSGPLHALEQQVQNFIPRKIPQGKEEKQETLREPSIEHGEDLGSESCHNVVPAHINPNFKVPPAFFQSGEPLFDIRVERDGKKVRAEMKRLADGSVAILVQRKEVYGQLKVHLDGPNQGVCASVDLENSVPEALNLWMQSQKLKLTTAKILSNRYTRLVEVRTTKPGFVNGVLELPYSAAQGLGAAVETVEKTALKHARVCHSKKDECFIHRLGQAVHDMTGPVQHARQVSEELIENTRNQISETSRQAKHRAQEVADQAKEEVSKAVQAVHSSLGELSKIWPGKVTETLAEAQQRAHKLVNKSRRGRKKGRKGLRG